MTEAVFDFQPGTLPLLVSIPHDGRRLPQDVSSRMTENALTLPDTDWHVRTLYEFCHEMGANVLSANFSRYVVDLNRPPIDADLYPGKLSTGVCPDETFAGLPLYRGTDAVTAVERDARVSRYWQPYHDRLQACLDELRAAFGYALLWDAHSIQGRVPRLFDGDLPDLSLGTNNAASCPAHIAAAVVAEAEQSPYAVVLDQRFRGGYITRHYGKPDIGCYAIQLELAQRIYMDEATLSYDRELADRLRVTLRSMLRRFLDVATQTSAE